MLSFRSPAKINLFLRVLSKRPDGYHALASLFQAIDLFDYLHFSFGDEDAFTCSDPKLPTDASNLVVKALYLFRQKTNIHTPVHIHLDKHIPAEAGLGGGSGNAATTLWAMNQLCGSPATTELLKAWSAEIGSDITFFLSKGTAYCTGRGEVILEIAPLASQDVWLVKPPVGLSTPRVYGALDAKGLPNIDPQVILDGFCEGFPEYVNDLEVPAFQLMPELTALKEQLEKQCGHALMCGSGTCFFCVGEQPMNVPAGYFQAGARFINRQEDAWY